MTKQEDKYPPDIHEYLTSIDDKIPITLNGLNFLVDIVVAKTHLTKNQAQVIVRLFFQVIRNAILKSEKVILRRLGYFIISCPKFGNKNKMFAKFSSYHSLTRRLNEDRR